MCLIYMAKPACHQKRSIHFGPTTITPISLPPPSPSAKSSTVTNNKAPSSSTMTDTPNKCVMDKVRVMLAVDAHLKCAGGGGPTLTTGALFSIYATCVDLLTANACTQAVKAHLAKSHPITKEEGDTCGITTTTTSRTIPPTTTTTSRTTTMPDNTTNQKAIDTIMSHVLIAKSLRSSFKA